MTQQNTQIAGFPDVWGGRSRGLPVDHQGPASYTVGGETFPTQSVYGGPNSLGLAGMLWCSGGTTESGNYIVVPVFGGSGKVAGTIKLKWLNAGGGGSGSSVNFVNVTAGGTYTGTAPTVTFAAAPSGGTTATGVAILNNAGTAVIAVQILNPGAGYLTAPAITFSTGGATATAELGAGGEVAAGTNLSAEVIRLLVIGG